MTNTSLHTKEVWKSVVDWEGIYEVSNLGRLRHTPTGRINTAKPGGKRGYINVTLKASGRKLCTYLHILVLRAFKGPPPSKKHECLHGDGNGSNNKVKNLRWGTRKENFIDMIRHGRTFPRKLTDSQVLQIKKRLYRGDTPSAISKDYGVYPNTITNIDTGKSYADVY